MARAGEAGLFNEIVFRVPNYVSRLCRKCAHDRFRDVIVGP